MQLLELTPAEIEFLTPSVAVQDGLQAQLTRRLAATLSARLRLPVQMTPLAAEMPDAALLPPRWQPDSMLASLWMTRRLGGQRVIGVAPFVPPSLIHTLDAVLAECWLNERMPSAQSGAMTWQITADASRATLALQWSHPTNEMTRWAQGVTRHG